MRSYVVDAMPMQLCLCHDREVRASLSGRDDDDEIVERILGPTFMMMYLQKVVTLPGSVVRSHREGVGVYDLLARLFGRCDVNDPEFQAKSLASLVIDDLTYVMSVGSVGSCRRIRRYLWCECRWNCRCHLDFHLFCSPALLVDQTL